MQPTLPANCELKQFDRLPDGLLDVSVEQLYRLIPEPSLFHLPGKRSETLFVSVLLHGNEPTGFLALQELLRKYRDQTLPRGLTLFFGNTQAARFNLRRLDHQPDFNRIWPGTRIEETAETAWARRICRVMRRRGVFASIDVHNNTGLNPHYACVNRLDETFLHLGALFGRLLVYFTHPKGVQSGAFAEFCPAVTLECGRPDQPRGVEHAFRFIDSCLHLQEFPLQPVARQDVDVYHTVAQVTVNEQASFSFSDDSADLLLSHDLERMNFTEITPGTVLGEVKSGQMPLIARDSDGKPITEQFFRLQEGQLQIIRSIMPSMLTPNERVIRQDCLCYLMERLAI
ncbi:succinylglutamate desuccinylase/aspartoacylase family protein [Methylomonas sp. LL1]|uniref:M14 family metallopeptidase n=1 Tax=Methylomonas sp. LL1 TaxID=2785785 RepID=UPI0018C41053|nr:M14 family metallopeptidase [Methylomonas sp. LL1]QPK65393.1 succinylglutamate desuccinylase/aspartoacylase family protein [Methylomonas sp. LL1]